MISRKNIFLQIKLKFIKALVSKNYWQNILIV